MTNAIVTQRKTYLGDGVYAQVDARGLVLTTEVGEAIRAWYGHAQIPWEPTNTVVLAPDVLAALERFVVAMRQMIDRPTRPCGRLDNEPVCPVCADFGRTCGCNACGSGLVS